MQEDHLKAILIFDFDIDNKYLILISNNILLFHLFDNYFASLYVDKWSALLNYGFSV